jgi:multidrug resistance efflux pump
VSARANRTAQVSKEAVALREQNDMLQEAIGEAEAELAAADEARKQVRACSRARRGMVPAGSASTSKIFHATNSSPFPMNVRRARALSGAARGKTTSAAYRARAQAPHRERSCRGRGGI